MFPVASEAYWITIPCIIHQKGEFQRHDNVRGPILGISKSTANFAIGQDQKCLIQLAIAINHADCHFKFHHNQSFMDADIIRDQSQDHLSIK